MILPQCDTRRSVAIIGSGPIGLDLACRAVDHGHDVTLIEQGEIAQSVRKWGRVKMFTPWKMNVTEAGLKRISNWQVTEDECPTGIEFAESYLTPIANSLQYEARILTHTKAVQISRGDYFKNELIGDPHRHQAPFRIIVDNNGTESVVEADILCDCSGVFLNPNPLGTGGVRCPGEAQFRESISYGLPTPEDISASAGMNVMLVGNGYSASSVVEWCHAASSELRPENLYWVTCGCAPTGPISEIPDDSLPGRSQLTQLVNEIALWDQGFLNWRPGFVVDSIYMGQNKTRCAVRLRERHGRSIEPIEVDRIWCCTGFYPDRELYRELQVHECYATFGPMNLAASLMNQSSIDCTQVSSGGSENLVTPERGFLILGAKSYGKNPQFLMNAGYNQTRDAIGIIDQWVTQMDTDFSGETEETT